MASSKDIFESHIHAADIFGAGIWRGVGTMVLAETTGLEYVAPSGRLEYRTADGRNEYISPAGRLETAVQKT